MLINKPKSKKGPGVKMKPSGIGGMAVIEGVMMKNKDEYAVAVRKPNNEIAVEKNTHKDFSDKVKLFKLPIFRGMLAFVDSLVIGIKVLNYSSSFFEEEEEDQSKKKNKDKSKGKKVKEEEKDFVIEELSIADNDKKVVDAIGANQESKEEKKSENSNALMMVAAVLVSIIISVALFMVLPVFISNLFTKLIPNHIVINTIEGILRLLIFIGYVMAAAAMPEIKRVFMYHGAEHKTINCLENGYELTVDNVRGQSRQHKRCGTSFMLLVMLISLIFFIFLPSGNLLWRVVSRIVLVPFIAGVSYEFIRLAGKSESKVVAVISQPGLWLQGLTTREPDDTMIEVAITSVEAVFDWKEFLKSSSDKKNGKDSGKKGNNKGNNSKSNNNKGNNNKGNNNQGNNGNKSGNDKNDSGNIKDLKAVKDMKENNSSKAGKNSTENKQQKEVSNSSKSNMTVNKDTNKNDVTAASAAPVKAAKPSAALEEDDEILKALDKYLDFDEREGSKLSAK
ncbi:MAG TPA: DUF1385 domain-containing protein [Mobilitalea sp.]|nr:DUF1385 domain-containing protein [Mobilitalea sp.]